MLKIKINTHGNPLPEFNNLGNWVDLKASERVEMKAGENRIIPLGISMELPDGYEAWLLPRSSTFKKWGITMTNSKGIIDTTYCGDNDIWGFSALAHRDTVVEKGDRIAQFRIAKSQDRFEWDAVDCLGNKDRSGFGSTGTK
jgi:dUTP pyrophosphatase